MRRIILIYKKVISYRTLTIHGSTIRISGDRLGSDCVDSINMQEKEFVGSPIHDLIPTNALFLLSLLLQTLLMIDELVYLFSLRLWAAYCWKVHDLYMSCLNIEPPKWDHILITVISLLLITTTKEVFLYWNVDDSVILVRTYLLSATVPTLVNKVKPTFFLSGTSCQFFMLTSFSLK